MVKYLVAFIAFMFVLSMFYNFSRAPQTTTQEVNLSRGSASATCKIAGYGTEVFIQPWTNKTAEIAKKLKEEGYLDYINVKGDTGVLVFSAKSNIDKIREAYLDEDVEVYSQSACVVNGFVNFTLENGSTVQQAPGSLRIYLDPFNRIGEEIDVDLVADISQNGIETMYANPYSRSDQGQVNASFICSDNYNILGSINWENRELNLSELNISTDSINYTKNDAVLFSRELNQSEIDEIKQYLNSSNISSIQIYPKGLIVSTANKELVENIMNNYNVNLSFGKSQIMVMADKDSRDRIEEYINSKGSVYKVQKGCEIKTENIGKRADGTPIFIPATLRTMLYYVNIDEIPQDKALIVVNLELIGMIATSVEFVTVR